MPAPEKKELTEADILSRIEDKLDDLITLLIIQGKEKEEQIKIMVGREYSNSQIADLLGIPKGTVDGIRAGFAKSKDRQVLPKV